MDFQELNKKMNDSEYQYNEAEATLKAHGGDRARNLEAISNAIHKTLENAEETLEQDGYSFPTRRGTGIQVEFHRLRGYAAQLRIIADELRSGE